MSKMPQPIRKNFDIDEGQYNNLNKEKIIVDEEQTINKSAIIRGEETRKCPFGLPITIACQNAGGAIYKMAPTEDLPEDEKEKIARANKIVYLHEKENKKCPYADKILPAFNKVDCDFQDTGQGQHSSPIRGSPIYPSAFNGLGLTSLYGFPLGYYSDYDHSRNLFYGLFSYLGKKNIEELIKLADQYDESGELEKADIIDNIVKEIEKLQEQDPDLLEKLTKYLQEYKEKYNDAPTGLIWQLVEQYKPKI